MKRHWTFLAVIIFLVGLYQYTQGALPNQLKTSRMSNSTLASQIDDKHNELEQALADIFGITLDEDITTAPTTINSSGQITFNAQILGLSPFVFEGSVQDDFETTFAISEPTADATITFANTTGTVGYSTANTITGDQTVNDNVKISLGTSGADGDLYSDGTDAILELLAGGDFYLKGGRLEIDDSEGVALGTGKDTTLVYDGTDTVWTLDAVGSGNLQITAARANSSGETDGQLNLTNTNAGAVGAVLNAYHNSSSPADSDNPFRLTVHAEDDTSTARRTHTIAMNFDDVTSTTLDSSMSFSVMNAVNASDANTTATLSSTGVWTDAPSFGEFKDYESLTPAQALAGIKTLFVGRYRRKGKPDVKTSLRHIGPTADEFYNTFKAGRDPRINNARGKPQWGIAPHDMAGVALMGVQGLLARVEALESRVP